jgi:protoporphyrin/coproporphyrin ferrochelatase
MSDGVTAANHDRVGVLIMAHGTPATTAEIEPFYTRIRRGSPPTPEQLADLVRRYDAIGGTSPLTDRTRAQVDGITDQLHHAAPGRYLVRFGAKHTEPFIEEAAAELVRAGVGRIVALVLTPHYSTLGTGQYLSRAQQQIEQSADNLGLAMPEVVVIDHWYDAPGMIDLWSDQLLETLGSVPQAHHLEGRVPVLFTAHSVPTRVVGEGDPYPTQMEDSADLVAEMAEIDDWSVAWQSAGRTPEPWLGPDLLAVIRDLSLDDRVKAVVVSALGFVSDHLEVLFDLDVEARQLATEVGLHFARTPSLNDNPRFLSVLANAIRSADTTVV